MNSNPTVPTAVKTPHSHELEWPPHLRPFDPWDLEIQADPYAHYTWMLEHVPVLRPRRGAAVKWLPERKVKGIRGLITEQPPKAGLPYTALEGPAQTMDGRGAKIGGRLTRWDSSITIPTWVEGTAYGLVDCIA